MVRDLLNASRSRLADDEFVMGFQQDRMGLAVYSRRWISTANLNKWRDATIRWIDSIPDSEWPMFQLSLAQYTNTWYMLGEVQYQQGFLRGIPSVLKYPAQNFVLKPNWYWSSTWNRIEDGLVAAAKDFKERNAKRSLWPECELEAWDDTRPARGFQPTWVPEPLHHPEDPGSASPMSTDPENYEPVEPEEPLPPFPSSGRRLYPSPADQLWRPAAEQPARRVIEISDESSEHPETPPYRGNPHQPGRIGVLFPRQWGVHPESSSSTVPKARPSPSAGPRAVPQAQPQARPQAKPHAEPRSAPKTDAGDEEPLR